MASAKLLMDTMTTLILDSKATSTLPMLDLIRTTRLPDGTEKPPMSSGRELAGLASQNSHPICNSIPRWNNHLSWNRSTGRQGIRFGQLAAASTQWTGRLPRRLGRAFPLLRLEEAGGQRERILSEEMEA